MLLARVRSDKCNTVKTYHIDFVEFSDCYIQLQCPHCKNWFAQGEMRVGSYPEDGVAWRECPLCKRDF